MKDFSSIAKLLCVLTENQSKFIWSEQCQETFARLKRTLTFLPILSVFYRGRGILDTDVFGHGIGAVFS